MPSNIRFEEPHAGLAESYRQLVEEFRSAGEDLVPFLLGYPNEDFAAFLELLAACKCGEGPATGFVPHSTYWLACDGAVVGTVNIRHTLNESLRQEGGNIGYGVRPSARRRGFAHALLRGALARARDMGMSEVLLTCSKDNAGSVRTIVGAGGVLLSEELNAKRDEIVQRYSIDLGQPAPSRK
jgi:predicted acetyltransferase